AGRHPTRLSAAGCPDSTTRGRAAGAPEGPGTRAGDATVRCRRTGTAEGRARAAAAASDRARRGARSCGATTRSGPSAAGRATTGDTAAGLQLAAAHPATAHFLPAAGGTAVEPDSVGPAWRRCFRRSRWPRSLGPPLVIGDAPDSRCATTY